LLPRIEKAYHAGSGTLIIKQLFVSFSIVATCNLGPARAQERGRAFDGDLSDWPRLLAPCIILRGICAQRRPEMA